MKKTRQIILIVGLIGTLLLFGLFLISRTNCYIEHWCRSVFDMFSSDNFSALFFTPSLFFLSLLTYKMRDEVFRTWLHFAYWWIPLSIILTLITPNGSGGWGIPNLISPELVALTFSTLFATISLIIITLKYLSMRPNW
jgi:hypothetical protein